MFVSISEAAKLAGVSRSTLYRAIETGRLSRTVQGIDVAELERVFGTLRTPNATLRGASTERPADVSTGHSTGQGSGQQAVLQEQLVFLQKQLEAEREEKRRLLDLLESSQRVLTHQGQDEAKPQSGGLFGRWWK